MTTAVANGRSASIPSSSGNGEYCDRELEELLAAGAIEPHPDPLKGWRIPELRLGGGEEPKEEQRSHEPVA
jgi:hypothetical protein